MDRQSDTPRPELVLEEPTGVAEKGWPGAPYPERAWLVHTLRGILAARALDLAFGPWIRELPIEQRLAVIEWQRTARAYELIQRVARREIAVEDLSPGVAEMVERTGRHLSSAIERSVLPIDLTVYRGIRNLESTFGTASPAELMQVTHREKGFLAGSVHAEIALRDFTTLNGALIVLQVPSGTRGIWVGLTGDPSLSWQGEILLPVDTALHIYDIDEKQEVPILLAQVI